MVAGLVFSVLLLSWWPGRVSANVEPDVGVPDIIVPSQVEAYHEAAEREMAQGEAATALAAVAEGLVVHPGDSRLLERRADILATQPDLRERAVELYQQLLTAHPDDLALKVKLANTWLALRHPFEGRDFVSGSPGPRSQQRPGQPGSGPHLSGDGLLYHGGPAFCPGPGQPAGKPGSPGRLAAGQLLDNSSNSNPRQRL